MPTFFISNTNLDWDIWTVLVQELIRSGPFWVACLSILKPIGNLDRDIKKTVLEADCFAFRLMQNKFLSSHSIKRQACGGQIRFREDKLYSKKRTKNE